MRRKTVTEAQAQLPSLLEEARNRSEAVMLTDDKGFPVGWLAPVSEDDIDDMLAQCPSFLQFIENRFAAAKAGGTVPLEQVKQELTKLED